MTLRYTDVDEARVMQNLLAPKFVHGLRKALNDMIANTIDLRRSLKGLLNGGSLRAFLKFLKRLYANAKTAEG